MSNLQKNNFLKSTSQILLKSNDDFDNDDKHFMQIALDLATQGAKLGEVPVGAVIVLDNQIIGQGFNCPICEKDSTAHAEILAIRRACKTLDNYRLMGATLYVTLEPCTMCLGAIVHSRIERVVFGTNEPKSGVVISQEKFAEKRYFNHYLMIEGGLFAEQSKAILQGFFKERRKSKKEQQLS
ncbi:tRNA adenosine(34) deaminase TadA [Moraxella oblonga]|uniref:tRNA adenosine(34) deaminase TadA n=1 Tax=Moraxella oblonga TaxID=200413 RepID=UPI000A015801|nr:tRNA adenosine(34) deaminase TadA [Moraxella oblonga]